MATDTEHEGRMTVVEHLTELRRRVIIIAVAFLFAASLSYWFAPDIIRFFLHYYKDVTHGTRNRFIFTGPLDALRPTACSRPPRFSTNA